MKNTKIVAISFFGLMFLMMALLTIGCVSSIFILNFAIGPIICALIMSVVFASFTWCIIDSFKRGYKEF